MTIPTPETGLLTGLRFQIINKETQFTLASC